MGQISEMMTAEVVMTLAILLAAVILFVTERLRVDLVALLVLIGLVISGLVTPVEAISGFGNPAVVTILAVFILSAGLSSTGVVQLASRQLLRLSGRSDGRLLTVVMLTAAVLSAFMNSLPVVALLLPVVLTMARQTKRSPSQLLLPLALGSLMGGLTTLIGTSPNILVSDALREAGLAPFQLFDFAPVGIIITLAGTAFMLLVGRHLLPDRHLVQALFDRDREGKDARELYSLEERLALVILPPGSPLAGKTLAESHIGQVLGLTILGLQRHGRKVMTIQPDTILQGGDRLLALGSVDRLEELSQRPYFHIEESSNEIASLFSPETGLAELKIHAESPFIGCSIADIDMRRHYHFNVLAIRRDGQTHRTHLHDLPLVAGDRLLLQGNRAELIAARLVPDFVGGLNVFLAESETAVSYRMQERLLVIRIPATSPFVGQSLVESHLGKLFELEVLGIMRDEQTQLAPSPEAILRADDVLLVEGDPEGLAVVRGLQGLVVRHHLQPERVELESEMVGLVEAVLSPHTTLVNNSLRDIHFREKYGLSVLAIWRDGRAYRTDLGDMPFQFGDAFLLYGPREKINLLSCDPDFLVLTEKLPEVLRRHKAPLAVFIMAGVVFSVVVGWLPLSIAALAGAVLMVLSGCLDMEEAYRQIEWRLIFLIAGMLPLPIAMEQSGTTQILAEGMVALASGLGTGVLLISLFILTSVASHFVPGPVVAVFMAPLALKTAGALALSPYALMMVIAIAASASFLSPVAHPANVLVMGPGGYRFTDYTRIGVPLTLLVLLVTLLVLPFFWPLFP